jgi:hypothetical protein
LPTSLAFSNQAVGTKSVIQTVTLTNTHEQNALAIFSILARRLHPWVLKRSLRLAVEWLHLGSATGARPLEKGQPDSAPSLGVNP